MADTPVVSVTIAYVRERPGVDFVDVMCLESTRFLRLSRSHEDFERLLSALLESEALGRPVRVTVAPAHGADIADVQSA